MSKCINKHLEKTRKREREMKNKTRKKYKIIEKVTRRFERGRKSRNDIKIQEKEKGGGARRGGESFIQQLHQSDLVWPVNQDVHNSSSRTSWTSSDHFPGFSI